MGDQRGVIHFGFCFAPTMMAPEPAGPETHNHSPAVPEVRFGVKVISWIWSSSYASPLKFQGRFSGGLHPNIFGPRKNLLGSALTKNWRARNREVTLQSSQNRIGWRSKAARKFYPTDGTPCGDVLRRELLPAPTSFRWRPILSKRMGLRRSSEVIRRTAVARKFARRKRN